jgi:hypothetical protein
VVRRLARSAAADDAMWRNLPRARDVQRHRALRPAANFESPAMMSAALKRIERSTFDQTAGFWRMHMVAFLDRPAPSSALKMRATDITDPRRTAGGAPCSRCRSSVVTGSCGLDDSW